MASSVPPQPSIKTPRSLLVISAVALLISCFHAKATDIPQGAGDKCGREPSIWDTYAAVPGKGAPGRCSLAPPFGPCPAGNSSIEPYIVGHNFILAHAAAAKLYKENYQAEQGGQIGIVVVGEFMEPLTDTEDDKAAAERYLDFLFGWHLEPLIFGDYPKSMREIVQVRLPTFTEEEKKLIKGSLDFIGVNYYTSRYAYKADPVEPKHYLGDFLAKITTRSGYVYSYPIGLQKLLEFMKIKYENPTIYITENGIPEANMANRTVNEAVNDQFRIDFIRRHLHYTNQAIKNGVNVKGYFYWSLFDNFEWALGYTVRYGLYYIDYNDNLKRIPRKSALWFSNFLNDTA
ncbi:Glycoside hydrolase [Trema orientale]|uniref:Glycoside hydrolase n=1 Tax=Trema orientale TaxID=63057 RepID=A0A2P5DFZ3_TREOI|nr:Glycoside hydrolase [Trema orientale]